MRKLCWIMAIGVLTASAVRGSAGDDDFKLEPDFVLLFNGKNLDGWKQKKGGDALDGKTEAYNSRFTVVDGKLVIDPKVKGDVVIETAKPLAKVVHIKFEFKPGKGCNNDLFLRGVKFDLEKNTCKSMKEGEWNLMEIIAGEDTIEYKCNGEPQRTNKTKQAGTSFGIRAEYGPVEIRRIRVKQTP